MEVDRDQVTALPALFDALRVRTERFVVLCDDLSFEEGAAAAKALKSALEGGVSGPPANVLFVATSNRRHLMPRGHAEDRGLVATAEDAEEEVSVSDRFGLWIGFPPMDQADLPRGRAGLCDAIRPGDADLDRRALQWSQLRGSRSGRVAWQFIRDLAGELGKACRSDLFPSLNGEGQAARAARVGKSGSGSDSALRPRLPHPERFALCPSPLREG